MNCPKFDHRQVSCECICIQTLIDPDTNQILVKHGDTLLIDDAMLYLRMINYGDPNCKFQFKTYFREVE